MSSTQRKLYWLCVWDPLMSNKFFPCGSLKKKKKLDRSECGITLSFGYCISIPLRGGLFQTYIVDFIVLLL